MAGKQKAKQFLLIRFKKSIIEACKKKHSKVENFSIGKLKTH